MPSDRQPVRFGVFEVNLETGEVQRAGVKVRIQEQPFQVLAALLEKPGEVVTKEELRERIWPGDTYVDFDRSLATAVNKVRKALGDSATRPRFIETVPKRGYRFLAEPRSGEAARAGPVGVPPKASRRFPVVAIAGVIAVGLVFGWLLWPGSPAVEAPAHWSAPRRITSDSGLTFQPTISRDGSLIAYASDRAGKGNLDIWVQQAVGGDPVRITSDAADELSPHFSPDGGFLVYRSERGEGGIYIAPSLGGESERLLAAHGHRPRFSPNGEWIAYFSGPRGASALLSPLPFGELWIAPAGGGTSRRLAAGGVAEMNPVWSADGSKLLVETLQGAFDSDSYAWRAVTVDGEQLGPAGAMRAMRDSTASGVVYRLPLEDWDDEGFVYFSSGDAASRPLWRIRVDPRTARVEGRPQRVMSGPGYFSGAALSESGRLVFADLSVNSDIWSLPIDADEGVPQSASPARLTTSAGADDMPSTSLSGDLIAFRSDRTGDFETRLLDLDKGVQRTVAWAAGRPILNPEGTLVALSGGGFSTLNQAVSVLKLNGSVESEFPNLEQVWGWSSDGRYLLVNRLLDSERAIFLLNLASGKTTALLASPERSFFQGQFSPDGRWLAWMTLEGAFVAPFQGAQPIPSADWVQISEPGTFADKPRWSPSGELLYHTSDRDGFLCIYARRLDPETKQPRGELIEIYHSHDARLSIANVGLPSLEIDVARDKIIFGMAELTGNIWMMEPGKRSPVD